jgi:4-amino-4-deoxy-L-arabinose transferase-like glycosyltransferase
MASLPSVGADRPGAPAIWFILALAWFATLGLRPLLEPDEGRYAEIPREMSVSGDWVTPRLNGIKYFEKPPLQYWATAAIYSLFGVAEWSARFWSCALAFLCIPLTYAFARHVYRDAKVAMVAAACLAMNPYFAIVGQLNLLDSGFCFFLVASLFAFLRARDSEPESSAEMRWMLAAAVALGLAVLSKGIAALVLIGGTLPIHMGLARDVRPLRRWHLMATLPAFLAVTVPWFLVVSRRNPEFASFFFIHEHFARYFTDVSQRVKPWWYFLPFVLLALLPWLSPLWRARSDVQWQRPASDRAVVQSFLLIWCAFVVFFFSVSQSKLVTYILPIMPPLSVLIAPAVVKRAWAISFASWVTFAIVAVGAAGLFVAAEREVGHIPQALLVWAIVAVSLGIVAAIAARFSLVAAAAGAMLAFQALIMSYSALPPLRTSKALVAAVRPHIGPKTQLFSVDQYRQSIPPYLGRTLRLVVFRGELAFGLNQERHGFIPTLPGFMAEWQTATDSIAFLDPPVFQALRSQGVPMRTLAEDGRTIAVSRE